MRKTIFFGLLIFLSMSVMSVWGWENEAADKMLLEAIQNDKLSDVELAIENGANVNYVDGYGKTALMYACEKQSYPIVKKLIDTGLVNASFQNDFGQTALMFAAKYFDNEVVLKTLVDKAAANINGRDNSGKSVLMYAVENKSVVALDFLLKRGANTNAVDVNQNDVMLWAVKQRNKDAVRRLINVTSVSWDQVDSDGKDAFMIACEMGATNIAEIIFSSNSAFDIGRTNESGLPLLLWLVDTRKSYRLIEGMLDRYGYAKIIGLRDRAGNDIYYYADLRNDVTLLNKLDEMEADYKRALERRKERKARASK